MKTRNDDKIMELIKDLARLSEEPSRYENEKEFDRMMDQKLDALRHMLNARNKTEIVRCNTCKHQIVFGDKEPCRSCHDDRFLISHRNWEPCSDQSGEGQAEG